MRKDIISRKKKGLQETVVIFFKYFVIGAHVTTYYDEFISPTYSKIMKKYADSVLSKIVSNGLTAIDVNL